MFKTIILTSVLASSIYCADLEAEKDAESIIQEMNQEILNSRNRAYAILQQRVNDLNRKGDLTGLYAYKLKIDELDLIRDTEIKSKKMADILNKIPGRTFGFYNNSGLVAVFLLETGGKIIGSTNINETTWKIDKKSNKLFFYRDDDAPSSEFTDFKWNNDKIVITGKFLLMDGIAHILKEL